MNATPMIQMMKIAAVVLVAFAGCSGSGPSSQVHHDAGNPDAAGTPPPPMLGAQIDRVGRPAISTLLIGTFADDATRTAVQATYRAASDPTTWQDTMLPALPAPRSIQQELETNLAVFDSLDAGMTSVTMAGCRNAFRYDPAPMGPTSYLAAARLLADDQLYVDTFQPTCSVFLALELDYGSFFAFTHTTCGGRMPKHDAIDMMYSVLAAGAMGVMQQSSNGDLTPMIQDGVPVHDDVKDTFPFLGPPR